MAISDLTNTTWVFNDKLNIPNGLSYILDFISNSSYSSNMRSVVGKKVQLLYDSLIVYSDDSVIPWTNEAYKTIKITGGTDATNPNLITWLQANATKQATPSTDTKPIFKRINGTWVKQDAFERVSGQWVKISTKEAGNLLTTSNDEILQDSNGNNLEFKEV